MAAELGANFVPYRGLGPMPPTDPVLYRLYEVRSPPQMLTSEWAGLLKSMHPQGVMVYGNAIKVSLVLLDVCAHDLTLYVYRQLFMRRFATIYRAPHSVTEQSRQFGDGIMSMIDCKVNVTRKPDPKGDRVVLTFEYVNCYCKSITEPDAWTNSGKFLPYLKW